jgi:1-acyl-sn-glycerol-3-phosphate acyltransferase
MSNHASHYDIPLTMATIPGSLRMLVKKELCRIPIWGRAMKASEYISIDRTDRHQAKKDLELAKQKMESGIILWMAPEGTRSRTGELQPFKKGGFLLAFQTDAIIIPMSIRGAFNVLPPKTLDFQLHQHVDIHFSQPIDTKNYSIRDRERLMKDVEQAIRQAI